MRLQTIAGLTAIAVFAVTAAGAALQASRIAALKRQVAGFEACEAAIVGGPKAKAPAEVCSAAIVGAKRRADQAEACDAALKAADLYAIRTSCSAEVKALEARWAETQGEAERLAEDLKTEREGKAAALVAAERRGQLASERRARAAAAVEAAPRDGDGLAVYDADRVCARWGCAGEARP